MLYEKSLKNLIERMNEYIKDRTEAFDNLFPCRRPKFDLKQSYMALNQKLIKDKKSSIYIINYN